jgi:hypothetical protein
VQRAIASVFATLTGERTLHFDLNRSISPRNSKTSMRGKRAVENNIDFYDLTILL